MEPTLNFFVKEIKKTLKEILSPKIEKDKKIEEILDK